MKDLKKCFVDVWVLLKAILQGESRCGGEGKEGEVRGGGRRRERRGEGEGRRRREGKLEVEGREELIQFLQLFVQSYSHGKRWKG